MKHGIREDIICSFCEMLISPWPNFGAQINIAVALSTDTEMLLKIKYTLLTC